MLSSEKKSLIRFLVIYLASTLLLFSLAAWIFYISAKHHLFDKQQEVLTYKTEALKSKLRILHQSNDALLYYPVSTQIRSAIFDLDKHYIIGTLPADAWEHQKEDMLYYRTKVEPYYLGAAYIVASKPIDYAPIEQLQKSIVVFMLAAGLFFSLLGYVLGRLFVAPMKESLEKMNHFIEDTTHELNTPISTILTNIEMIETFGRHTENSEELKRIEIASKTLSRIYDDLTYLNLNHQYHRHVIELNMSELIEERIIYFTAMAEAKNLEIVLHIHPDVVLLIDKNDALRLVDNLFSNAIKYNKHQGKLEVTLNQDILEVADTGIGINPKDLTHIMQRFKRANQSEGGFGIGLHIVSQVCTSYAFGLKIDSVENEGTQVQVRWKK